MTQAGLLEEWAQLRAAPGTYRGGGRLQDLD